jgi:quercetin dioxygenase-like cupin family protein
MADNPKDLEIVEGRGGLEPAQKQNLVSLVSYQSGSVVSRTIINRRTGTMTLFAFDEGEGLSEHTAPYDALLHVLEGEAQVSVSGEKSEVKEGEAIVLPAGKPHAVRAAKRFKMLLTMIRA